MKGRTLPLSNRNILVRLTALSLIAACAPLTGASEDKPASGLEESMITIGEEKLTRAQVDKMVRLLPPRQRSLFSNPARRKPLADYIVRSKLYSREARKRGLDEHPEVQQAIRRFKGKLEKNQVKGLAIKNEKDREQVLEIFKESLLARIVEKELKRGIPVSSQEVADYFRDHPALFDMVRGRRLVIRSASSNYFYSDNRPSDQILSDDEARARAEGLRQEIQEGADFEVMAAKHSDDALTSGVGGDTGIVRKGVPNQRLVTPPEEDLLFAMEVGDLSPVVGTPLGFAVLKLEEKRKMTLDEAQPEIKARIRARKLEDWYQQMRLQHNVIIDPSFFATPATPARVPSQP